MRIDDEWYNAFLTECRAGLLTEEMYDYLMGFPTEHAGSWMPTSVNQAQRLLCGRLECERLPYLWKYMALAGAAWSAMQEEECEVCKAERGRRNRLVEARDPRILQEPFLSAPYVHQNNAPKYHAMLLRAVEEELVFF